MNNSMNMSRGTVIFGVCRNGISLDLGNEFLGKWKVEIFVAFSKWIQFGEY